MGNKQNSDFSLLKDFHGGGSQTAFRELVERHGGMVYGAALRRTNNPQLAEEVVQNVFAQLSSKAGNLIKKQTPLSGWLHLSTRYESHNLMRHESRLKKRERGKVFLALNKIDEMPHDLLLAQIAEFGALGIYEEIFVISALNMDGVDKLSLALAKAMPTGPYLYPEDQAADIPSRLMAAEITREKIFLRLHDELPYASTVETEKWKQQKNGDIRIDQVIYVRRDSQKPIVLGKGGKTIKDIGAAARRDMQDWLGRKVHLFLFVKVRDNWQNDKAGPRGAGSAFGAISG